MLGSGALAEQDVERPAHACTQGIGGAYRVERLPAMACRQQQQQAGNRQGDPDKVDGAARGADRHGERASELQCHGNADRHCLQRHIEEEVHAAECHAIDDDIAQGVGGHTDTPWAQDQ
ncbi:hypothetical protein D3C81_1639350 [compost metagenome]